jgi:pimeloyl-ACP methyl ester carboxylesterase
MARKTAFTVFTCGFIIPARRTGWQEDLEGPIQKGIVAIPWKGGEGARPSAPKAMRKQSFVLDLGKEGRIIRGDLYAAEDARRLPTLVILHGFKGFKDWGFFPYAAETLAKRGFGVITFNFSMNGVGENLFEFTELDKFARNTYSREQEDVAKIIGEIKAGLLPPDGTLDPDRLGLIGHSRGGANSLLYALEDPNVKGVVTWNGVADVDIFPEELKREIREKGVGTVLNARTGQEMPIHREVLEDLEANRERWNLLKRLPEWNRPLLILQGDQDVSRLVEGAHQLHQAAPQSTLRILPGANHTFGAVHPFQGSTPHLDRVLEETANFFAKVL